MCRVTEPNRGHSHRHISDVPPTHTELTHVCSHIQRNHHYRDCLYNVKHIIQNINTYILVCLKTRHEVNITRTPWSVVSSLPIPDTYHLPQKTQLSPTRTRHYRLSHPQNTPEQTWEKTPIIRRHAKLRLNILTKSSFHRTTKATTTHPSHTG